MLTRFCRFVAGQAVAEGGATAVEYALIVTFIATAIVVVVATLGAQVLAVFQSMVGSF
jgi:Flp pilus assembly pilin Flp